MAETQKEQHWSPIGDVNYKCPPFCPRCLQAQDEEPWLRMNPWGRFKMMIRSMTSWQAKEAMTILREAWQAGRLRQTKKPSRRGYNPDDLKGKMVRIASSLSDGEFSDECVEARQPGALGIVTIYSDSHGLCFKVLHEDETRGWYLASELTPEPKEGEPADDFGLAGCGCGCDECHEKWGVGECHCFDRDLVAI